MQRDVELKNSIACPECLEQTLGRLRSEWTDWNPHPNDNPFSNTGASFVCETFSVQAYSWSDDQQPFNFKCGDIEVSWYKYLGRAMTVNRDVSIAEALSVYEVCAAALDASFNKNVPTSATKRGCDDRTFAVCRLRPGAPLKMLSFSVGDVVERGAENAPDFPELALRHARELIAAQFGKNGDQVCDLRLVDQADFLRDAATRLGMTHLQFAERIDTPFRTFGKWLLPQRSDHARNMPHMAWTFIDEIVMRFELENNIF